MCRASIKSSRLVILSSCVAIASSVTRRMPSPIERLACSTSTELKTGVRGVELRFRVSANLATIVAKNCWEEEEVSAEGPQLSIAGMLVEERFEEERITRSAG